MYTPPSLKYASLTSSETLLREQISRLEQQLEASETKRLRVEVEADQLRQALNGSTDDVAQMRQQVGPAVLCYQVLHECEHLGAPNLDTVERLKAWLDTQQLSSHRVETLRDALRLVQAYRQSGQKSSHFAFEHNIDERTLRTYRRWWDLIQSHSMQLSPEPTKFR